MKKNRRRIIFTVLEILAVLLLLGPVYRLVCGIGLEKIYSNNGITIYADDVRYKKEAKQMAETLRVQLLEVDSSYSPKSSVYFCRTMAEFHKQYRMRDFLYFCHLNSKHSRIIHDKQEMD